MSFKQFKSEKTATVKIGNTGKSADFNGAANNMLFKPAINYFLCVNTQFSTYVELVRKHFLIYTLIWNHVKGDLTNVINVQYSHLF